MQEGDNEGPVQITLRRSTNKDDKNRFLHMSNKSLDSIIEHLLFE